MCPGWSRSTVSSGRPRFGCKPWSRFHNCELHSQLMSFDNWVYIENVISFLLCCLCNCVIFHLFNLFWVIQWLFALLHFQVALNYFVQAAEAGNANAMAFLGKVPFCFCINSQDTHFSQNFRSKFLLILFGFIINTEHWLINGFKG